jgi:thiamine-phosphate pyrophosphorylase
VCLVTDRRRLAPRTDSIDDQVRELSEWLADAPGNVDLVQIRERDLDAARLFALAAQLLVLCRGTSTKVVLNTRADVARAVGADGVHLRADGLPADRVRAYGPDGWMLGSSVHTPREARLAAGVDYLIFGTVFASLSKPGAPLQGIEGLRAAVRETLCPVLAIGGLTPNRAAECRAAGAAGVAAIGPFLPEGSAPGALGIRAAAGAFRRAMAAV